jgi:hypothetical protein
MRKITRSKSKQRASESVKQTGRGERFGWDMNLRGLFDEIEKIRQALEKAPWNFG